jgi:hypothetical protein
VDPSRVAVIVTGAAFEVGMDYAARDCSVDAVIGWMPGTADGDWEVPDRLDRYGDRPVMLVVESGQRAEAQKLAEVLKNLTVESSGDLQSSRSKVRVQTFRDDLSRRIVDFLGKAFGPAGAQRVVASIRGRVYYAPGSSRARRLSQANLRWFNSPAEAQARGLRASTSFRPDADSGP